MDPIIGLGQTIGAVIVAAIVAVVVGRRRGLDAAEARSDAVTRQLVEDLQSRVNLLETANREKDVTISAQNQTIAALTAKVTALESDLTLERRITQRMRQEPAT